MKFDFLEADKKIKMRDYQMAEGIQPDKITVDMILALLMMESSVDFDKENSMAKTIANQDGFNPREVEIKLLVNGVETNLERAIKYIFKID